MQEIKRKHTWTEVLGSGYQYLVLDSRGKFHLAYWMVFCPYMISTKMSPKEIRAFLSTKGGWSADWVKSPEKNSDIYPIYIYVHKVFQLPKIRVS